MLDVDIKPGTTKAKLHLRDRNSLISVTSEIMRNGLLGPIVQGAPFLSITCDCGKMFEYKTDRDVPCSNVKCDCGAQIILYDAELI